MGAIQIRNADLVDILRTDFQHRNEPNFAWKSAVSTLLGMTGIIAVWPMSAARRDSATDRARDIAGGGYHLTQTDTIYFGSDNLVSYAQFNGTASFLSRVDGGPADWADVLGTEGYILPAQRGLTIGGWFKFDVAAGAGEGLIAKDDNVGVATESYSLRRTGAGSIAFRISDGIAFFDVAVGATVQDVWYFIAGRFLPSTETKVWINNTVNTLAVAIPATLNDSDRDFRIGRLGGLYFDGYTSLCFLCACAVPDAALFSFFQQTRAMFGV